MSIVEEAVRDKLLSDSAVSALVSERVYASELPQKPTYPAIIYEHVDSERDFTMEGPSGFVTTTMEIRVYASSYSGVKDLATKIRQVLNGLDDMILGVKILGIFLQNESDDFDEDLDVNISILDYSVNHDEVV